MKALEARQEALLSTTPSSEGEARAVWGDGGGKAGSWRLQPVARRVPPVLARLVSFARGTVSAPRPAAECVEASAPANEAEMVARLEQRGTRDPGITVDVVFEYSAHCLRARGVLSIAASTDQV